VKMNKKKSSFFFSDIIMKFSRKTVVKKRVYKKRVSKPTVSVAVKKYVNRKLGAKVENKSVQINGGVSFGNVLESPDFNAFPLCPLSGYWGIAQGVAQGQRIGNEIKPKQVYLNYVLRPKPYDPVNNAFPEPVEVQMLIGHVKQYPASIPVSTDINQLFQSGSSTAAPIGTLRDIISVINSDYWTIKKRWNHKIGYASITGSGGQNAYQYFANNDFKMNAVKRVNISKMIPNTLKFNDGVISSNKNIFLMYYAVASDGRILSSDTLSANLDFWIDFNYEDA